MSIEDILAAIDDEINSLRKVRNLLAGTASHSFAIKPVTRKRKRKMSAEARKRIADAQRKRWAKQRAQKS